MSSAMRRLISLANALTARSLSRNVAPLLPATLARHLGLPPSGSASTWAMPRGGRTRHSWHLPRVRPGAPAPHALSAVGHRPPRPATAAGDYPNLDVTVLVRCMKELSERFNSVRSCESRTGSELPFMLFLHGCRSSIHGPSTLMLVDVERPQEQITPRGCPRSWRCLWHPAPLCRGPSIRLRQPGSPVESPSPTR